MKALILPTRDGDPFLASLAPALEAEGVEVDDLSSPHGLTLLRKRLAGFNILHMQGMPIANQRHIRSLLRWCALLRIRVVWNIGTTLPRLAHARDVENLRILFRGARVRIVSAEDIRARLRDDFGLSATTFVIPPTESIARVASGTRLAYETSLEPPMPVEDRTRPPGA